MCPHCGRHDGVKKQGFFARQTGACGRIQRYRCKPCGRFFSAQTKTLTYRERKPDIDQDVAMWLCSGVSQRRLARNLGVHPITIARKLVRLGYHAAIDNRRDRKARPPKTTVEIDEMETFEHTKCKPLAIALAVDSDTRRIIAAQVSVMPAKGRLAEISRRRYGYRPDRRSRGLRHVLRKIRNVGATLTTIKSDECPRYPELVKETLPGLIHLTYKGRRARCIGQGELKRGGRDPIFSLNHTCAKYRDDLKRLSRRSWCTTKLKERLQAFVEMYIRYHNETIEGVRWPQVIGWQNAGK